MNDEVKVSEAGIKKAEEEKKFQSEGKSLKDKLEEGKEWSVKRREMQIN